MTIHSRGKGRKKAVQRFTTGKGLWMVVIIAAAMIAMVVLWLLGILNFEMD